METLIDLFNEMKIGGKVQFENKLGCFELRRIKEIKEDELNQKEELK